MVPLSTFKLPEEVVDRMCVPLAYRGIEPLLLRFLAFHHLSKEDMITICRWGSLPDRNKKANLKH
jgi:hypothetical protein